MGVTSCEKKKKKKRTGLSYSNGCCLNSFKLRGDQVAGVHAGCKDGGVQLLASCFPRGTFFCESGDAGGRYGTQRREAIVDMKAYCLQGKFNTFLCCRLLTFIELDSSLGSFTATPPLIQCTLIPRSCRCLLFAAESRPPIKTTCRRYITVHPAGTEASQSVVLFEEQGMKLKIKSSLELLGLRCVTILH